MRRGEARLQRHVLELVVEVDEVEVQHEAHEEDEEERGETRPAPATASRKGGGGAQKQRSPVLNVTRERALEKDWQSLHHIA